MYLKRLLVLHLFFVFIAACSNEKEPEEVVEPEEPVATLMWEAMMNDSTDQLEMRQEKPVYIDSVETNSIITYLNNTYPNVQLELERQSNDTLFLRIPDAMYLTQQMGSTGPVYYFATAVYNLTEIEGVRYVRFEFEEGDHAYPQTFSRESVVPK